MPSMLSTVCLLVIAVMASNYGGANRIAAERQREVGEGAYKVDAKHPQQKLRTKTPCFSRVPLGRESSP